MWPPFMGLSLPPSAPGSSKTLGKASMAFSMLAFGSDHQVHLFHEHSSVQVHSTKLELSSVQVQYFSGDNNWTKFSSLEKVN